MAPCLLAEAEHAKSPECKSYDSISATFPSYVNPVSITDEYEFKQEIGKGSYSVVYLAVHVASKMEYAVKVRRFFMYTKSPAIVHTVHISNTEY